MSIPFTWLYLIHDEFTGLYKIGKSDDPVKRLRQLRQRSTIPAAPTDTYSLAGAWLYCQSQVNLEKSLHERFERVRVRGEWFRLSVDDVSLIKLFVNDLPALRDQSVELSLNCVRTERTSNLLAANRKTISEMSGTVADLRKAVFHRSLRYSIGDHFGSSRRDVRG